MNLSQMNHHGGRALIRHTWLSWMQHRGFFFLLAFMWMIPPLIYLFVWSTAAAGPARDGVGGLARGELVTYYLVLILVNQLTFAQTNWTVGDLIREGQLNVWLLRPLSPLYQTLATEIAGKVVYLAFVIPVTGLLALLLRPTFHPAPADLAAFVPALVLAWALRFFWGYWLALLAFWATRADALLRLQDALLFLLAGQVAPIALLPGPMRRAAVILPFRYMVGFPVEVLTGQLDPSALRWGFVGQVGWLVLALILFKVVWRAGLRRYSAVGG